MSSLPTPLRIALTVFVIPFFVGGILLATAAYSWLVEPLVPSGSLLWLLLPLLAVLGIALGGLLAYGILIFLIAWRAPSSPLLVEADVTSPSKAQRILYPMFHLVGKLARRLARACRNDAAA